MAGGRKTGSRRVQRINPLKELKWKGLEKRIGQDIVFPLRVHAVKPWGGLADREKFVGVMPFWEKVEIGELKPRVAKFSRFAGEREGIVATQHNYGFRKRGSGNDWIRLKNYLEENGCHVRLRYRTKNRNGKRVFVPAYFVVYRNGKRLLTSGIDRLTADLRPTLYELIDKSKHPNREKLKIIRK